MLEFLNSWLLNAEYFDSVFVKWLELYHSVCSLRALFSAALPCGECSMRQVDPQHRAHPHFPG